MTTKRITSLIAPSLITCLLATCAVSETSLIATEPPPTSSATPVVTSTPSPGATLGSSFTSTPVPTLTVEATQVPIMTATPVFSVAVQVEAATTQLQVGEMLTVTVSVQNQSQGCDYPLYEVSLRLPESGALFEAMSPTTLGPPGPNPATFALMAVQPGTVSLEAAAYGERYCHDYFNWRTITAVSEPITIMDRATSTPASDFSQGTWRLGSPMLAPARSEMPTVTLDRWIYVSGGFGGPARLERYNPSTDQWQSLATMPGERHHLMSSAYDHRLYVFGGAEGQSWTPTNTVWQYDPDTDQWRDLVSMPESRLAGTAVTLGDKVYIVGGIGGSEALLEFTPIPEAWHLLPGPRQPREHVSAVAFQDEVWVLGGRWHGTGELATVEIYSPVTNTWRDGPTLNVARAGFGAAVVDDHIVVAGGEVIINGTATLDSVEILSAGSRNWQFGPRMSIPMHGVGGAALEGQFLLLGGSLKAGAIQNAGQVQIYEPY